MKASIREFEPSDEEPVAGPSLRAWEPVFAEEEMLGPESFVWLRPQQPLSGPVSAMRLPPRMRGRYKMASGRRARRRGQALR